MRLEEAIASLNDEQRQELAKLENEKEIKDYLKEHNLTIDENYELSDDELDNVNGGLDFSYIIRLLLKKFGVIDKGEEILSSLVGKDDPNKNDNFM